MTEDTRTIHRRTEERGIGTYAVGLLYDILRLIERLQMGKEHRQRVTPFRTFWFSFRMHWRNKSYWNGYLAEWHYPPNDVIIHKCGHGWTRRRALRRLGTYLVQSNLSWQEEVEYGNEEVL